ncbi:MAG: hypothetical protein J6A95_04280 [Clostridia bacterium]|nr:hypothetical protein [Clostridia bacterium]
MNILVFGSGNEVSELIDLMNSHENYIFRKKNYTYTSDYDELLKSLKAPQDIIFVLENGAKGMESVIASRDMCPKTPVIWFSNDMHFGAQSYRLGTDYFGIKPVTNEHLALVAKKLRLC